MKKSILSVLFPLFVFSSQTYAQFYISLSAGGNYAFFSKEVFTDKMNAGTPLRYMTFDPSGKITPSSFGAGTNFNFTVGGQLSYNISTEITFSYIESNTFSYDSAWTELYGNTIMNNGPITLNDSYHADISASMLRIIPTIKISGGTTRIRPYLKAGLIIKLGGTITENNKLNDFAPGYDLSASSTTIFDGAPSFGFLLGPGCEYKLADYFSVFLEFNMIIQEWTPDYYQLIDNSSSGSILKSYSYPFSSFGFNIGLKYSFGKDKTPIKRTKFPSDPHYDSEHDKL